MAPTSLPNLPSGYVLRLHARLRAGREETLAVLRLPTGEPAWRLATRVLRPAAEADEWDRLQNYRRYAGAGMRSDVLECTVRTAPPFSLIEAQREEHERRRALDPTLAPYAPPEALARGEMRVGVPLAISSLAMEAWLWRPPSSLIEVRVAPAHIELVVNGHVVDEEWPAGALDAATLD